MMNYFIGRVRDGKSIQLLADEQMAKDNFTTVKQVRKNRKTRDFLKKLSVKRGAK